MKLIIELYNGETNLVFLFLIKFESDLHQYGPKA